MQRTHNRVYPWFIELMSHVLNRDFEEVHFEHQLEGVRSGVLNNHFGQSRYAGMVIEFHPAPLVCFMFRCANAHITRDVIKSSDGYGARRVDLVVVYAPPRVCLPIQVNPPSSIKKTT